MNHNQSITRASQLTSWGPKQTARVRVGIGVWLLVLTAILYAAGVGGLWEISLVAVAALHFALASRPLRIARQDRDPGMSLQ